MTTRSFPSIDDAIRAGLEANDLLLQGESTTWLLRGEEPAALPEGFTQGTVWKVDRGCAPIPLAVVAPRDTPMNPMLLQREIRKNSVQDVLLPNMPPPELGDVLLPNMPSPALLWDRLDPVRALEYRTCPKCGNRENSKYCRRCNARVAPKVDR